MQVTNQTKDLWCHIYDTHQEICNDNEILEFKKSVHGFEIHKGNQRLDVGYNVFYKLNYPDIVLKEFFLPRFTKQVWKVENAVLNIFVQIAVIFFDLITLPYRFVKYAITPKQEIEHPFCKYLNEEKHIPVKVLNTNELEIKVLWITADDPDLKGHRYYNMTLRNKKISIEKTSSSQEDSVSKTSFEGYNAKELSNIIASNFDTKTASAYFERYAQSLIDQNPTVDEAH